MRRVSLIVSACLVSSLSLNVIDAAEPTISSEKEIVPLLQKYCVKCHRGDKPKGDFDISHFKTVAQIKKAADVMKQQFDRLLADPRSAAFAETLTGQWLGFAALGNSVMPDEKKYPQFTPELPSAMR
jgi:hypothetical protein